MTFEEFEQRYNKEMKAAQDAYEEWLREEEEAKKNPPKPKPEVDSILIPAVNRGDDAEFLLENLLLATSLMTVAMHHLSYYAGVKGKHKLLDNNDQLIMKKTADEIEAFINLMEGEGVSTDINKG
jgi:hypothetical protein